MRSIEVVEFGEALQPRVHPTPTPAGTEVLLRIRAAGVCHTDLHIWRGGYDLGDGRMLSMAARGVSLPHTLGHENVGEVVAAGPDASGVEPGQVRLVYPWIGCGQCRACTADEEHLCSRPQSLGVFRKGGYADHLIVPHPRYLFDIGSLDPLAAAPMACAGLTVYSALKKLGKRIASEPVLVIGAGGLGLMCIAVLRALGGMGAIVVDRDEAKRASALQAGALAAIDSADANAQASIAEAAGARGVSGAVDFVGAPATVQLALASLEKGGCVVVVGLYGGKLELPLPPVPLRALAIVGSFTGSRTELGEFLALIKDNAAPGIPTVRRSLDEANATLLDLEAGRLVGRAVLVP